MKKNIAVYSKNFNELVQEIDTPTKSLCHFSNILKEQNKVLDLVIIESENPFKELLKLKERQLIQENTPCILISNDLKIQPHQELTKSFHKGIINILRNPFRQYEGLSKLIANSLEPNMPSKKNEFLFVIPMFNEKERMHHVLNFLDILLNIISTQKVDAKVRFINDGSNDSSPEILQKALPKIIANTKTLQVDDFIEIVNLPENTRKAGMYQGAVKNSEANYYFFLDADNAFFEEDITKAISLIKDGYYDVIQATKDMTAKNRPPIRKLLSFCKRICTYLFLPKGVVDSQTGFKLINANSAKHIMPHIKNEYGFASDLQFLNICKRMKFRTLQLPVQCIEQEGSHVDPVADAKRYLVSLFKIATKKELYHDYKI